jgi:enoyl-CoA hydratase/carnithine racemase
MAYEDLRVAIADGIAELTLDRPSERNAFSGPMAASLARAYRECDARDDVRAVIVTGAGAAFCVGADLGAGADTSRAATSPSSALIRSRFPRGRSGNP